MNNQEITDNLVVLARMYADSAWNYERAIDVVQDEDFKAELAELHDQHLEHMENLNGYIKQFGGMPSETEFSGDISGELEIITDDMPEDVVIAKLRGNEKVLSSKLQVLVEQVQIPELAHDLEEDLEDEDIYLNTLKDHMS